MKYKVSVIVPNYNGLHLLKKHLPVLVKELANKDNSISDIVVVDNGSTDGSVSFLNKHFPDIQVVKLKENRGFAIAINMGVRYSKGNLLLLLNNDVEVTKGFLLAALKHFENNKVFAVSLHEKGYGPATASFAKGFLEHKSLKESKETRNTFWVSGGSGIFRRSIWKKLKGLDEKIFSPYYWEDLDLSYRATKRGYALLWEGRSSVYHDHESTAKNLDPKKVSLIRQANELKFIWKNIGSKSLFRKHVKYLFSRTFKHPGYIRVVLKAARSLKDIKKARKKEKKEAVVSDESIFSHYS